MRSIIAYWMEFERAREIQLRAMSAACPACLEVSRVHPSLQSALHHPYSMDDSVSHPVKLIAPVHPSLASQTINGR